MTYFVVFDNSEYDLMFLYYCLKGLNLQSLAKGVKPGINRNDVYALECAFPSLPEQKQIVERLGIFQSKIENLQTLNQQKLIVLSEFNQSILQKAFAGELTTTSIQK